MLSVCVCVSDGDRQITGEAILEVNAVLIFCGLQLSWMELRIYNPKYWEREFGIIPGPMMVQGEGS